ncbi:nucleolar and spindle-associated protein 1 isoform 1-T1 [Clarias gariepinus]
MDLDSMKYADLRQLAKSVGLKGNMKADKLLKALKQHFQQQESSENENSITSDEVQIPQGVAAEPKPANDALVTTRRGKKQQTKRKHSGHGNNNDPNPEPEKSPVQDDAKAPAEEEVEDSGKRSSKRRKVSSGKDTGTPAPESVEITVTKGSNKDVVKKTAGKIPRHEGLMKKKAALRPTTPNFKKLHEAHFSKMESIDSYVQRKNKQMEVLRNSVKDLKAQTENSTKKSADAKPHGKLAVSRNSLFSPGASEKRAVTRRATQVPTSKPVKDSAPFRPSILSANKINVRFSETTQDNEHKRSLLKTPARMSPMFPLTPTPGRKSEVQANKNAVPVNKTPALTPFMFGGAAGTPGTNKKNAFDLKASLSRPLGYKPHKGKLKPFGVPQTQENAALNKSQTLPSHQKNYKQHQVQTRDERRVKHNEDRRQKKEKMLGARRGLVMA